MAVLRLTHAKYIVEQYMIEGLGHSIDWRGLDYTASFFNRVLRNGGQTVDHD